MRKVILSIVVSLDGYIEGMNGEVDWFVWDETTSKYTLDTMNEVELIMYGRKAYEANAKHWQAIPNLSTSTANEIAFAHIMNEKPKLVFSKTMEKAEWNARLVKDNIVEEIQKEKQKPGKDMVLFAGSKIAQTFINLGLIDEYRFLLHPIILGKGNPLFGNITASHNLKLIEAKSSPKGIVILRYQP